MKKERGFFSFRATVRLPHARKNKNRKNDFLLRSPAPVRLGRCRSPRVDPGRQRDDCGQRRGLSRAQGLLGEGDERRRGSERRGGGGGRTLLAPGRRRRGRPRRRPKRGGGRAPRLHLRRARREGDRQGQGRSQSGRESSRGRCCCFRHCRCCRRCFSGDGSNAGGGGGKEARCRQGGPSFRRFVRRGPGPALLGARDGRREDLQRKGDRPGALLLFSSLRGAFRSDCGGCGGGGDDNGDAFASVFFLQLRLVAPRRVRHRYSGSRDALSASARDLSREKQKVQVISKESDREREREREGERERERDNLEKKKKTDVESGELGSRTKINPTTSFPLSLFRREGETQSFTRGGERPAFFYPPRSSFSPFFNGGKRRIN